MKIFPKDSKLEAQFLAGQAPEPEALLGPKGQPAQWRVAMKTGPIPNMGGRRFRHRKSFVNGAAQKSGIGGCNIMFADFCWGGYKLEKAVYAQEDGGDGQPVLFINYVVPENGFICRRIRDHLRTTADPDVMIGRFHYRWRGRLLFLGYFTLTRIKNEQQPS